jgi:hypothetical protein
VTGIGCAAQLFFAMEQGAAGGGMYANGMQTNTQPDGSFSREGFEAGKWSVTATTADGKFAQQAHIEVGPDSDSGELVFALSPGGKLRFDYKGAQPEMLVSICSQGSLVQFQSGIRSGKASEYLAPAGSLVLEIRKSQGGPARTMTVELKAGETKEILLADED